MTAVEWLIQQIADRQNGRAYGSCLEEIFQQALEMEKQYEEKFVLDLLRHELGHDS